MSVEGIGGGDLMERIAAWQANGQAGGVEGLRATLDEAQRALLDQNPQLLDELMRNGQVTLPDGTTLRVSQQELRAIQRNESLTAEQKQQAVWDAAIRNRILDSGAIRQEDRNSCVAASVEQVLAKVKPDQYRKLAQDLASVGMSVGPKGQLFTLSAGARSRIDASGASEERKMSMRMQAAFMEQANGRDTYDADRGASVGEDGRERTGLSATEAAAFNASFGITTVAPAELAAAAAEGVFDGTSDQRMLDVVSNRLSQSQAEGQPFVAVFRTAGDTGMAHQVNVVEVAADGSVTFDDPAQGRVTLSGADFVAGVALDGQDVGTSTSGAATRGTSTARRR
jgi:hypothetical protein